MSHLSWEKLFNTIIDINVEVSFSLGNFQKGMTGQLIQFHSFGGVLVQTLLYEIDRVQTHVYVICREGDLLVDDLLKVIL